LKVAKATIYRWAEKGLITLYRFGEKVTRVRRSELDAIAKPKLRDEVPLDEDKKA